MYVKKTSRRRPRIQESRERDPAASHSRFVDNRPDLLMQRKSSEESGAPTAIQRAVDVKAVKFGKAVQVSAYGPAADFTGGTEAKNRGWVNVEKYQGKFQIGRQKSVTSKKFKNRFTQPEAGHCLAATNGGNGSDPANIFAQDGGSNNGQWKSFERQMSDALKLTRRTDPQTPVQFTVLLHGENVIGRRSIKNAAESEASSISDAEALFPHTPPNRSEMEESDSGEEPKKRLKILDEEYWEKHQDDAEEESEEISPAGQQGDQGGDFMNLSGD